MRIEKTPSDWRKSEVGTFWRDIAAAEHVLQIYANDEILLSKLHGFVSDGITNDEVVLLIGTPTHIACISGSLASTGQNLADLCSSGRLILLDAAATLSLFMVDGMPDAGKFRAAFDQVLAPTWQQKNRLRAFGEMVALLWAEGNSAGAVALEKVWNDYMERNAFLLFCAYPRALFSDQEAARLAEVCCAHRHIISGTHPSSSDIYYRNSAAVGGTGQAG
jgi:hypothetical protein